jgi:hypothetical protein
MYDDEPQLGLTEVGRAFALLTSLGVFVAIVAVLAA